MAGVRVPDTGEAASDASVIDLMSDGSASSSDGDSSGIEDVYDEDSSDEEEDDDDDEQEGDEAETGGVIAAWTGRSLRGPSASGARLRISDSRGGSGRSIAGNGSSSSSMGALPMSASSMSMSGSALSASGSASSVGGEAMSAGGAGGGGDEDMGAASVGSKRGRTMEHGGDDRAEAEAGEAGREEGEGEGRGGIRNVKRRRRIVDRGGDGSQEQ